MPEGLTVTHYPLGPSISVEMNIYDQSVDLKLHDLTVTEARRVMEAYEQIAKDRQHV